MHLLLPQALMVWLNPPNSWSVFLHIDVLSLLHFCETTASSGCIPLSISAGSKRGFALELSPWLFPVTEPGILLQRGLVVSVAGLCGEQGYEDAVLPTECPPWGQVRASPYKALDVCMWGGNGTGGSSRLQCQLFCTLSWAMLFCWWTDSLCLHVERVLKGGRTKTELYCVLHIAKSSNGSCGRVLIMCAWLFERGCFYFSA